MSSNDATGARKGDYIILGVLGAGGMGKVYKVRNSLSDRVEAMKVLLPDLSDQKDLGDRFLREIKVLASLHHPNIAELRTALTIDNQLVMIMEYVEGVTLSARLAAAPIPYADTLAYIDQVLSALSYAHSKGVVHRDIKPANMIVTAMHVTKLMDFGIARSTSNDMGLTMTGTTLGSVAYMSPEQVRCEPIDARSDLYSIGVSLYEMVTGQRPYVSDNNFEVMQAHLQIPPTEPKDVKLDIPAPLSQLIMMAMAKDPAQRFQTADAFRAALQSVAPLVGPPTPAIPVAPPSPTITAEFTPVPHAPATPRSITARPVTARPITAIPAIPPPAGQSTPPRSVVARPVAAPPAAPAPPPPAAYTPAPAIPVGATPGAIPPPQPPKKSNAALIIVGAIFAFLIVLGIAAAYIRGRSNESAATRSSADAPDRPDVAEAKDPKDKSDAKDSDDEDYTKDPAAAAVLKSLPCKVEDWQCWAKLADAENAKTKAAAKNAIAKNLKPSASGAPPNGGANSAPPSAPTAPNPASPNANPAPASTHAGPDAAALAALEREELDDLNKRATKVATGIESVRATREAQGQHLPTDIDASRDKMKILLNQADSAIASGNVFAGQKFIDLAESEIKKQEKFVGR
jgi:eukaryotic-like serine/threonine-protein kinase